MKPFAKVDLHAARWMLRRVTYTETPPDAVCQLELAAALVAGDLPSWTQREWARRWKCTPKVVRRIAGMAWDHYGTTTGPERDHYGTTLLQSFPHLRAAQEPPRDQSGTSTGPTCARSSLKSKREEVEVEEQQAPSALDRVAQEWGVLWAARSQISKAHSAGAPRGGVLGKGARKAIAAALKTGASAEDLILVARWAFLAPGFSPRGLRGEKEGAPLNEYLSPVAVYRTTKLDAKLEQAQRWEDQGCPVDGGSSSTPPKVREMVVDLRELIRRHEYLTYAVRDLDEPVAEQFAAVLEQASGQPRTEVWAYLRDSDNFTFERVARAARKAVGA